jgi:transposase-like protein
LKKKKTKKNKIICYSCAIKNGGIEAENNLIYNLRGKYVCDLCGRDFEVEFIKKV